MLGAVVVMLRFLGTDFSEEEEERELPGGRRMAVAEDSYEDWEDS